MIKMYLRKIIVVLLAVVMIFGFAAASYAHGRTPDIANEDIESAGELEFQENDSRSVLNG